MSRPDLELAKFLKKNNRTAVNVTDFSNRATAYGEQLSVNRKVIFDNKANTPSVSVFRNNVIKDPSENDSTAEVENGEYKINCVPGTSIKLETADRGRYQAGYEAQAGIGVRIPTQELTGDSKIEWGYFQGTEGLGFGLDSEGFYTFTLTLGNKKKTRQGDFTTDNLDGKGRSGYKLDLSDGLIFQIDFSWYGYGAIRYAVLVKSDNPTIGDYVQTIHRVVPKGDVSITQPNQQIALRINNDQSGPIEAYVGGRQFSVIGDYQPQFRVIGQSRGLVSGIGTTLVPLISFKRKESNSLEVAQAVQLRSANIATRGLIIFGYIFGGELTGADFQNPVGCCPNETTLETDISATAITGGIAVGPLSLGLEGQGNRATLTSGDDFTFDLIGDKIITLVARAATGTTTIDAATMNMTEEW